MPRNASPENETDATPEDPGEADGDAGTRAESAGRRARERARLATADDDLQVLVAGGGPAGLAAAATVHRAGYDPVVLAGRGSAPSRLAVLQPVGTSVLDRLAGLPEECRAVDPGGERTPDDASGDGGRPVVVTTDALERCLRRALPGDAVREDCLERVEPEDGALRVRLGSGVREWFDVVVATDDPATGARQDPEPEPGRLSQVETHLPEAERRETVCRTRWTEAGLLQTYPHPGGGTLCRVTADRPTADGRSPTRLLERAVRTTGEADESDDATAALEAALAPDPGCVDATAVGQSRPEAGRWADGRVARCGAAALAQAPATGLRTTLALADARVLADELVAGPSPVAAAIEAYGRRRRRHVSRLVEGRPGHEDCDASGPLASVWRFRSARRGEALAATAPL